MNLSKDIIEFNSHTAARDKIFRIVQYGSKLILCCLTRGSSAVESETVIRLKKLEAALGLSRKLFRMGNSIDMLHKARDALKISDTKIMILIVISQLSKAIWLVIDHLLWLGKVGLVKIDLQSWTQRSLRVWLLALISATVMDFLKLSGTKNKIEKFEKEKAKIPPWLQVELRSRYLNFGRDFCDMFIPLSGLSNISPCFGALCGTISSGIGFKQEWEKHISPYEVKP